MRHFVGDDVSSTKDGARINRHENEIARVLEHEPQRLAVSRTVMRFGCAPMRPENSSTRASSTRFASRFRKSSRRRGACSLCPETRISRAALDPYRRRSARRGVNDMRFATKRNERSRFEIEGFGHMRKAARDPA